MADLSQTARNPNEGFMRAAPRNPTGGSLFFEAPKLNQPRSFRLKSTGMAEQSNFGGGSGGGGDSAGALPNPFSDLTPAQQAAYYAANPTMASITQFGQKAFGLSSLGMAQNYFAPDFVNDQRMIAQGIDPEANRTAIFSNRGSELLQGSNTEAPYPDSQEMLNSFNQAYAKETTTATPAPDTGGGGYSASDYGGYSGSETQSSGEAYANYKGGLVSNVFGPDPAGPDEGAGYLQRGEYVIKKSAVDKYGQGLLDMINEGKIPTSLIPAGSPVLAKTWDAVSAQRAKMLEDIGADPKTIWQQTGTWKGPDGKWRQEVMQ